MSGVSVHDSGLMIIRDSKKNVLFNDALNTFSLQLYGVTGYSFRSAAMVLLYVSSHRQDNIYYGLCYTSRAALAGKRNS